MKRILSCLAVMSVFLINACSMLDAFKPKNEQVRQEPNKTVYKSTEQDLPERPILEPAQKVPGE